MNNYIYIKLQNAKKNVLLLTNKYIEKTKHSLETLWDKHVVIQLFCDVDIPLPL